jgi:hypothetical protein
MADIYLPTLHDGQLKVWSDSWDDQLHAVRCGRRWGKTFMLSSAAVTYATAQFKRPGMDISLGGASASSPLNTGSIRRFTTSSKKSCCR